MDTKRNLNDAARQSDSKHASLPTHTHAHAKSVLRVLVSFAVMGGLVCVPFQLYTIVVGIPAAKRTAISSVARGTSFVALFITESMLDYVCIVGFAITSWSFRPQIHHNHSTSGDHTSVRNTKASHPKHNTTKHFQSPQANSKFVVSSDHEASVFALRAEPEFKQTELPLLTKEAVAGLETGIGRGEEEVCGTGGEATPPVRGSSLAWT
jgi:hypothetical protein